jgi:hypothetical protein
MRVVLVLALLLAAAAAQTSPTALFCGDAGIGPNAALLYSPPPPGGCNWQATIYFTFDKEDASGSDTLVFPNLLFPEEVGVVASELIIPNDMSETIVRKPNGARTPVSTFVLIPNNGPSFDVLSARAFPLPPVGFRMSDPVQTNHIQFFYQASGPGANFQIQMYGPQSVLTIAMTPAAVTLTSLVGSLQFSSTCTFPQVALNVRTSVALGLSAMSSSDGQGLSAATLWTVTIGTNEYKCDLTQGVPYTPFVSYSLASEASASQCIVDEFRVVEGPANQGLFECSVPSSEFLCVQRGLGSPEPTPPPTPAPVPGNTDRGDDSGETIAAAIAVSVVLVGVVIGFVVAVVQSRK